jgi:hypothetical protein
MLGESRVLKIRGGGDNGKCMTHIKEEETQNALVGEDVEHVSGIRIYDWQPVQHGEQILILMITSMCFRIGIHDLLILDPAISIHECGSGDPSPDYFVKYQTWKLGS